MGMGNRKLMITEKIKVQSNFTEWGIIIIKKALLLLHYWVSLHLILYKIFKYTLKIIK